MWLPKIPERFQAFFGSSPGPYARLKVGNRLRLPMNDFSRAKIEASVAELKEEKSLVSELL